MYYSRCLFTLSCGVLFNYPTNHETSVSLLSEKFSRRLIFHREKVVQFPKLSAVRCNKLHLCAHDIRREYPTRFTLRRPLNYKVRKKSRRRSLFIVERLQGRSSRWCLCTLHTYMKSGWRWTIRPRAAAARRDTGRTAKSTVSITTAAAMPSSQLIQCCVVRSWCWQPRRRTTPPTTTRRQLSHRDTAVGWLSLSTS